MRLTLRTLLAYLDDLLEPADAEDLGHKIEGSEFASAIVARIHDCTRRLRLGVPNLSGRGMGGDPNTVAEYLDNTMSPDLVPEFERVCLESDVHLAEVAACHQILTLVLGEPAEVEPASRQRMYAVAQEQSPVTAVAAPEMLVPAKRSRPSVPDYLRESESRSWTKLAVAGGALVVLLVIVVASLRIQGRSTATAETKEPAAPAAAAKASAEEHAATEPPKAEAAAAGGSASAQTAESSAETSSKATATVPPATPAEAPAESVAGTATTHPTAAEPTPGAADAPQGEPAPTAAASATPATAEPSDTEPGAERPSAPAAAPPAAGGAIGRYVSEGQVLLRFQPPDDWLRLPARDPLTVGDQIVSLPAFRGTVSLNSGVTAQIFASTRLAFQLASAAPVPELYLDFGRVMVLSSAHPDAKVLIRVGEASGTLSLSDPSSVVAVEVLPVPVVGADPTTQPGVRRVTLYVGQGTINWQGPGMAKPEALTSPAIKDWSGQAAAETAAVELPSWVASELELTEADRRAADLFVTNIGTDRSARLGLTELANDRRFEMKSLAVRSLGLIDSFEPLVLALGESTQRGAWSEHIETLRMMMARGPEVATKVRQAFEKRRPKQAAALFRMLAGYTEEQLQQGSAAQLVSSLDSPDLDMRVLAIWNLEKITGQTWRYRPHDPPNLRQPQVRRWKLWLQKDEKGGGAKS